MATAFVEFGEPTDLLVVNTCSCEEDAEADLPIRHRKTLRTFPRCFVAVTGCYAHRRRGISKVTLCDGTIPRELISRSGRSWHSHFQGTHVLRVIVLPSFLSRGALDK